LGKAVLSNLGTRLAAREGVPDGLHSPVERLVHGATERLESVPGGGARLDQVDALRRFLRLETERLRMRHRVGLGGDEIAAGRSQQVDLVVQRVCQLVAAEFALGAQVELNATTVVALGGYGRGELAPFSDIDMLFLHSGHASDVVREFVERTLALLWDTGFTVGHSFRTVDECIAIAREDLHSRTAMAEARRLVGSDVLFGTFERRLDEAMFRSRSETEAFVAALRAETEARYQKYGRGVGLLEPNVKQSAGGLRDLHTILWLGHARLHARGLEGLRDGGHLSADEYAVLRRARAFLARIRNEAHFCAGRKADQLTLELQPELAANLGYRDSGGLAASERLMRDYYKRAHELHHVWESFAVRNGFHARRRPMRLRLRLRRSESRFEVHDGLLHFRPKEQGFDGDPLGVLGVFDSAQSQSVEIGDDVKVAVRKSLGDVDAPFRSSREAARTFLRILGRRGRVASTLRAMHDTGFLNRYLPEFARVTFLVQHDHYHRYTVDEHTLTAIEALDEVAQTREPEGELGGFKRALDELDDAAPLYLALLLHDIGKGRRGSHVPIGASIAARVGERLQIERSVAEDIVFLVGNHLAMSQLSQRRDLSEEALIRGFTEGVGSLARLNQLLLLTYADNRGVGPAVWSAWKAALLWELYAHARGLLTGKATRLDADWRGRVRSRVVEELAGTFPASETERHLAMLPDKYLRTTRAAEVAAHLRLVARLAQQPLVVEWSERPDGGHTQLTVCTQDAPGTFARLAGTLTAHSLNILSVDVFTREDGVVLDTFTLGDARVPRPVVPEQRRQIEADLAAAVAGTLAVASAVEAWRARTQRGSQLPRTRGHKRVGVRFDTAASPVATVVEVAAEDELGLAYRIASTLSSVGLNITFAKIGSEKSQAWDVFYVTGVSGEKLSPSEMQTVEGALMAALDGGEGNREMEGAR
jgi:[protein-PII] uridylyltransferase